MNIDDLTLGDIKSLKSIFVGGCSTNVSLASRSVGKNVIVRSRNEGINFGEVVQADDTGIVLKDCIRIWYHRPENKASCWYEGVAMSGLSSDSKTSCPVLEKVIVEDYSIILCTSDAITSIKEHKPNAQS